MLAVLLLPGCTAAEVTSAFADLRWHVSQVFHFSAPPPVPAYPAHMAGGTAVPATTAVEGG
jgi:hypothetical protein